MNQLSLHTGWRKKRPEHLHGIVQQSNQNESTEKHVFNKQTSPNKSSNVRLKHFCIGRDTNEIEHKTSSLVCRLHRNVTVIISQLICRKCAE